MIGRRSAESWCRSWLNEPCDLHERLPRGGLWVDWGLGQAQYWGDARIGAGKHLRPLIPGARGEGAGEPLAQHRPAGAVVLAWQVGVGKAETPQQRGVELRLE